MKSKKVKALALLSGGLDSALAIKLVLDQGIEVTGVYFTSPFFAREKGKRPYAEIIARRLRIPVKKIDLGMPYLEIIEHPSHGHGAGLNPCIDCKIHMFRKAKALAKKLGAQFIITGEVLNQRPMSQHFRALHTIEEESGMEGKILRPLSAGHLPVTEAEARGWVRREKLLSLQGRQRKVQFALARKFGIKEYSSPAGGCLLTQKEFSRKLRDLIDNKGRIKLQDVHLLKVGRHFRLGESKMIVGRNHEENQELLALKGKADYMFEVPDHGSPTTLLQGPKTRDAITLAARLTARYSDCKDKQVTVHYGTEKLSKSIRVEHLTQEEADKLNLTSVGR